MKLKTVLFFLTLAAWAIVAYGEEKDPQVHLVVEDGEEVCLVPWYLATLSSNTQEGKEVLSQAIIFLREPCQAYAAEKITNTQEDFPCVHYYWDERVKGRDTHAGEYWVVPIENRCDKI